jgi:predicted ArsR family transcriptional regulator
VSIDPPRRQHRRLPLLSEATPGVGYERDAFLRALVVQLAASAETELGPAVAEQLVAQVGLDVGMQMEAEYRGAMGLDGPLQPHHLAECYVRLKQAIGGGFQVMDVSEEEITLENSACPFGTAVQHSPGLCRMTSSVFGGIAATATGAEAVVSLEERIAVGDPRCRVVIRLGRAATADVWGHRYRPPELPG